jgi:hypothetical protein
MAIRAPGRDIFAWPRRWLSLGHSGGRVRLTITTGEGKEPIAAETTIK